jgi:hypothetical protein
MVAACRWPPPSTRRRNGIGLMATTKDLTIIYGKSQIALSRIDHARGPIEERPLKPNPRHRGKVVVPPDPVRKRVAWSDTWLFSARVPMPQHRSTKKTDKT